MLLRSALGAGTPVLQTVFNPLSQAKHLAGDATLLAHLRTDPEAVRSGLRTITETTRLFIAALKDAGADGIFYAVQHAQTRLLSESDFEHFSRADDMSLLRAASSLWCNVLHLHGDDIHFASVCDYPANMINWHDRESGPSLEEAAGMWAGALCGGLSRGKLVLASADDVRREAADALSNKESGRLLLSTGCVVPIIAPHGNLLAAARATSADGATGSQSV